MYSRFQCWLAPPRYSSSPTWAPGLGSHLMMSRTFFGCCLDCTIQPLTCQRAMFSWGACSSILPPTKDVTFSIWYKDTHAFYIIVMRWPNEIISTALQPRHRSAGFSNHQQLNCLQQFVLANNKNIKALHYWRYVMGNPPVIDDSQP